jgi:hypothetical protein
VVAATPPVKTSAATAKEAILVFTDMIDSIPVWVGHRAHMPIGAKPPETGSKFRKRIWRM